MNKKTFVFQTEIKQLLDIMINSLYQNKEIFLRELISNASDAIDKLKFESLKNQDLLKSDYDLKININLDKINKVISITDNGIGMTKEEIIENLGTIAKSGTKEFLKNLTINEQKTSQLIGKFGVGFYSTFIIAKKVIVESRKAGVNEENAVRWESSGDGEYSVTDITKLNRGTTIFVHLKDNEHSLLNYWKIKKIISTYSDHISLPIYMQKENSDDVEIINKAVALWAMPKSDITEKQYIDFYKHITNDTQDPLTYVHSKVEGNLEYTILLYIPAKFPYELTFTEKTIGLKLYIQRVFILDNVKQFLPNYFRFIKGIVDSNDLPLNVSREVLQENVITNTLKTTITSKIFTLLDDLEKNKDKYNQFWNEFGKVLKEGPAEDYTQKERIAKYFRFTLYLDSKKTDYVSLDTYIEKSSKDQKEIYYLSIDSFKDTNSNPYLEIFKKKNIPVLLFFEKIDEWLITHLSEYKEKKFKSVLKSNIHLDDIADEINVDNVQKDDKDIIHKIKEALKDNIKDVRISRRLIKTPSCIVVDDYDMTPQMERILKQAGKSIVKTKPTLEINLNHTLIKKIASEDNKEKLKILSNIIYKQALLVESGSIENPSLFVEELNSLLDT